MCVCSDTDDGTVVFAHQTTWQQRLLELYGTHMCLIDATYKTTVYEMPLFFLCVPANVGFVNVATFLLSDECTESITAGLQIIADGNPSWRPAHFLTDFHEGQICALKTIFPGTVSQTSNSLADYNDAVNTCKSRNDVTMEYLSKRTV